MVLLVVNTAGWIYYNTVRASWDQELGRSMTAVASTAASRITGVELGDLLQKGEYGFAYSTLRHQLQRTQRITGWVRNAFVFDREGHTLLDLEADPPLPGRNPALNLDRGALATAFAGRPAATRLFSLGGVYYKMGYAPVGDDPAGTRAVLAVEADAAFFNGLRRLRENLLAAAAVSTLTVLVLGFLFARATRSLMAAEERARRSETLASMGQMAATMAHEIRNPLAIIQATAERLKKAPPEDEIWQYIPEEVERLNGILSTYLDFARSDPTRAARMDLVETIERVRLITEPMLGKQGIQVETRYPEGPAFIQGSPAGIRQAVLNLVLNAQEAMPAGGTLGISVSRAEKRWVCEVRDTGHGIPREVLRRIFDPFYSHKERGTGLGLAVVDRIVREHDGRIEVNSRPDEGSAFRLLFRAEE